MSPAGIEIERKFRLRTAPGAEVLAEHGAEARRIEQVYVGGGRDAERIRRTQTAGAVEYRRTSKRRIGPYAFEEREETIDESAWTAGLQQADPARRPICKTRYVVPHGEQRLEIDVFEEPPGMVVVEVELRDEDEAIELPAWLGDRQEVTGDPRYFNAALAYRDAAVPAWGSVPVPDLPPAPAPTPVAPPAPSAG